VSRFRAALAGASVLVPALLASGAHASGAQAPAWTAPAEEKARANPLQASDDALRRGRVLYQRYCQMCHGERGKGDGAAARMHAQRTGQAPKDLTDPKVQGAMTDGEIFWKVSSGLRDQGKVIMPGFAEELPKDEDRWKLVLFVRAFGPS
jgi:mono/diheme cytochrome c family protein